MTTETYDAWDAAMEAKPLPNIMTLFGELQADVWPCALVKGQGKVPFDPQVHNPDQRRTAIDLILCPLRTDFRNTERHLIAESNAWAKIMLPSLKALGTDLRTVNGKYVQVQLVPTGRKYTKKTEQPDGTVTEEEKEETTFKFVAVYDSLEACTDASNALYHNNGASTEAAPAPAQPQSNGKTQMTRQAAAGFLLPMWTAAGKDRDKFLATIAANPMLADHFTADSPEVLALING